MPDPLQRVLGLAGAIITLPLLLVLGLAVRLDSRGPALHASRRLGAGGRPFRLFKLRTMTWRPDDPGARLTAAADPRVTRVGRFLRRTRLDELPQMWQVAAGRMRLVGPRPEDPAFVDLSDPIHREVFTAKPGLTGLAQLLYVDEADRLDAADPDSHYRREILPAKLRLDVAYLRHRSTRLDLWILAQTPMAVLGRRPEPPPGLLREFGS
jgi:lipopolysaccharide/colanic/teichoic acid biosynthesis glycosyltransferase